MMENELARLSLKVLDRALKPYGYETYHYFDNKTALKFLANIETLRGPLDPKLRALCDEYAQDVFKKRFYAPWLYTYAANQCRFVEGWIPDNFYGRTIYPQSKGEYGALSNFKSLSPKLLDVSEDLFPSGISMANGVFFDRHSNVVPENNVAKVIFAQGPRAVFKTDRTGLGMGVKILHKAQFSVDQILAHRAGVIQPFIQQHPSLEAFGSKAAATIRVTTAIPPKGEPSVRSIFLRLGGTTNDIVDTEGLYIPMDMQTGVLDQVGFAKTRRPIRQHPGSGVEFAGFQVPKIQELKDTALMLHSRLPFVNCIGWDFGIDTDSNLKVFEWNGAHNSIKFGETTQGPGFTDMGWEKYA